MDFKWLAIYGIGVTLALSLPQIFKDPAEKRVEAFKSCMKQEHANEQICKELAFGKGDNQGK